MHSTRESALAFVAGKKVAEVVALSEEIYDEEMSDRIWRGTEALARLHLDAGQRVWLVTATPVELATIIARRLELTGALGTVAESVDGVYTGRLVGDVLHGEAKAAAVRALAAREGLRLAHCSAYSDSINDLPMLETGGASGGGQSRLRAAGRGQAAGLGDPGFPHRAQGGADRDPGRARPRRGRRWGGSRDRDPPRRPARASSPPRWVRCRPRRAGCCAAPDLLVGRRSGVSARRSAVAPAAGTACSGSSRARGR